MALKLELSVGKGGSPFAEPAVPVSVADGRLEPVEATLLSGKGGKLDPLEVVVSSLGKGGNGDWLAIPGFPLTCLAIEFFFEAKYICLWKRPIFG
jgi:hypothetical protein